jgi:hypothetical protein
LERQLEQERQANSEHRRLLSAAGVHKTAAKQGRGYAALLSFVSWTSEPHPGSGHLTSSNAPFGIVEKMGSSWSST